MSALTVTHAQVIVGANGSGKSTILKLVARIYDPTEGVILLDGKDIKTLRLADLRRAMAILFQDYSHFPLSVRLALIWFLSSHRRLMHKMTDKG